MKKVKRWIRRRFAFTQRETNGFLLLLFILVLSVAAPFFYRPASIPHNITEDRQTLDSLMALLEKRNATVYAKAERVPVKLFLFNPNTLAEDQWQKLGINRFLAQRIINYRTKAGGFKYKEDLGRIYGLSDSVFQQLYPYIDLPPKPEQGSYAGNRPGYPDQYGSSDNRPAYLTKKGFRLQPFDLNNADTTELKRIKGIGSKLSLRILKYRDRLGGFHSPDQLQEVFALPPNILDSLHKYTYIENDFLPARINLNTITFEELKVHPYLPQNVAKAIIAYR